MRPADLFLSADLTEAQARAYLGALGFRDPAAVDDHLQQMAGDLVVREALGRLAGDLIQSALESPDPDASVSGLADYLRARTGRVMFLDYLRDDPRALHVLTYVLGASPVLTEMLIRTPEYFHWLVPQIERSIPDRQDHEEELVSALSTLADTAEALDVLRRWKRRETLRIGTRELLRRDTVPAITSQLSDIACVAVDFALAIVMRSVLDESGLDKPPGAFTVVATGQLGAAEMGYGSDIDLLYVFDSGDPDATAGARDFFVRAGHALTAALGAETREGSLYQVRPVVWPQAACSLGEYATHFSQSRDAVERGTLTRARTIAGDMDLGRRFLDQIEKFVYGSDVPDWPEVHTAAPTDDIDRFALWVQLRHGAKHPPMRGAGTLTALQTAARVGAIPEAVQRELDHAYVIIRSAQHRAQLGVAEDLNKQIALSQDRAREICRGTFEHEMRRSRR